MEEIDYEKLGLKCGIEIHQQLDTKKLFCQCPSKIREDKPDVVTKRKMRAVAGELGAVDPAALHEFLKNRQLIYEAYSDSNCLVELDEEPPHEINEEALDIVLQVALLLHAKPFSELQVMRKTVIDGSNTSGFQRTLLVAIDGYLESSKGRVKIPTICLEEDAARKVREDKGEVTYRLDRLGIPLIELATAPDIKTPAHTKEVAEKLGMILRATGKVKRGLGTIRQDLNVSILGGERTEIKGVQDLRLIPKLVELEVKRQLMLEEVRKELEKRKIKVEGLRENFVKLTEIFKVTKSTIILNAFKKKGEVLGIKLTGFSGLLKNKLGPELAEYAKIAGVKGIFHSDELPGYGISAEETRKVKEKLKLSEGDAFVLVAEEDEIGKKALQEVIKRGRLTFGGVIDETRKAKEDGGTEFMRPLPGSARMYPETDHPLIKVTSEKISKIKKTLPKLPEEKLEEFLKIGLGKELASQLLRSKWGGKFEELTKKFPQVKPSVIATTLISLPKEVKKRYGVDTENLGGEVYEDILKLVDKGKITKDVIPELLAELGRNPKKKAKELAKEKKLGSLSQKEMEKIVEKVIKENGGEIKNLGKEKTINVLLGRIMAKVQGRGNPQELRKLLAGKLK